MKLMVIDGAKTNCPDLHVGPQKEFLLLELLET